jgi:hypothetical protein
MQNGRCAPHPIITALLLLFSEKIREKSRFGEKSAKRFSFSYRSRMQRQVALEI